jgi:hypothetical protein
MDTRNHRFELLKLPSYSWLQDTSVQVKAYKNIQTNYESVLLLSCNRDGLRPGDPIRVGF